MEAATSAFETAVAGHADRIWGADADPALTRRLIDAVGIEVQPSTHASVAPGPLWDERDVVLITYGDSVTGPGTPLQALGSLVRDHLRDAFGVVHILPFFPYSADRGFAVIDFEQVDPALGSWDDVDALAGDVDLMFDLVCNHVSTASAWFRQFLDDEEPGRSFIRTASPDDDLRRVVRPRSLPLLTPFDTARGRRHVWTTFSADQADLDWSNPDLAAAMLDIIDGYLRHGARFLRLDAVAFLWKEPGTTSIHLPQTHELVKLMRTLLSVRAPRTAIITETNVPDVENRSYFGSGDEAHLVYNFALPPLLVDAILRESPERLAGWLDTAPPPPPGCAMFNFIVSHDGIGLRPAEGLLNDAEIADLVEVALDRGGLHGTYDRAGEPHPYELNISLPDLFGGPADPLMVERVLLAHTIVLSLAGVPAMYVNTLLATVNDHDAVASDGVRRSINRPRVALDEMPVGSGDWRERVFTGLIERCTIRRGRRAFHPDGRQRVRVDGSALIVERTAPGAGDTVTLVANLAAAPVSIGWAERSVDLISGSVAEHSVNLAPHQAVWLVSGAILET